MLICNSDHQLLPFDRLGALHNGVQPTGAEGLRAKEGAMINKSLLTLGVVINKLSEGVHLTSGGPCVESFLATFFRFCKPSQICCRCATALCQQHLVSSLRAAPIGCWIPRKRLMPMLTQTARLTLYVVPLQAATSHIGTQSSPASWSHRWAATPRRPSSAQSLRWGMLHCLRAAKLGFVRARSSCLLFLVLFCTVRADKQGLIAGQGAL